MTVMCNTDSFWVCSLPIASVTWTNLPLWVSNLYGFLQMLVRKLAVKHLSLTVRLWKGSCTKNLVSQSCCAWWGRPAHHLVKVETDGLLQKKQQLISPLEELKQEMLILSVAFTARQNWGFSSTRVHQWFGLLSKPAQTVRLWGAASREWGFSHILLMLLHDIKSKKYKLWKLLPNFFIIFVHWNSSANTMHRIEEKLNLLISPLRLLKYKSGFPFGTWGTDRCFCSIVSAIRAIHSYFLPKELAIWDGYKTKGVVVTYRNFKVWWVMLW